MIGVLWSGTRFLASVRFHSRLSSVSLRGSYQPLMAVGQFLYSARVKRVDAAGSEELPLDTERLVMVELVTVYPREVVDAITPGFHFRLFEGVRCVGDGIVVRRVDSGQALQPES